MLRSHHSVGTVGLWLLLRIKSNFVFISSWLLTDDFLMSSSLAIGVILDYHDTLCCFVIWLDIFYCAAESIL